mgnify:CR=1 FL=1
MPKYLADVHMHADYDEGRDRWHGERPKVMAKQIVEETRLNFVALTEHNMVSDSYFDLQEEIARLLEIQNTLAEVVREIDAALGLELAVIFEKRRYHLGYVFADQFFRGQLPDVPPRLVDAKEIEHFREDYPGVAILNHPTWKDRSKREYELTQEFMESGIVDGVEVMNGSIVHNGNGAQKVSRRSSELFIDALKNQKSNRKNGVKKKDQEHRPGTLAPIGSSDAHKARHVGNVATEYSGDDPSAFFEAVKSGRTVVRPIEEDVVIPRAKEIVRSVKHLNKHVSFS